MVSKRVGNDDELLLTRNAPPELTFSVWGTAMLPKLPPLSTTVPLTLAVTVESVPPLSVRVAPELTVTILTVVAGVELTVGALVVPDGITAVSVAPGTPLGLQFVDVFQLVEVAPVQVR